MLTDYFSYKVKIKPGALQTEGLRSHDSVAHVSFFDENKKEISYIEAPFIDLEQIFQQIDNGECIDISNCYVENFSLRTYRKSRKIGLEDPVKINGIKAGNAVFETDSITDFSFADFGNFEVDFSNSKFLNGKVSFKDADFGTGTNNFAYALFSNGNVDFSNTRFGDGGTIFKNAVFKVGHKIFQYASFGVGDISFVNTDFGDGDVDFINTDFSEGDVSFKVARFGTGKIDFHFATFGKGDISFERTEFGDGKTDFRKVEFSEGKVNFNRANFGNGDVNFEACQLLKGRFTIKKAIFGSGEFNFEQSEFDKADLIFESVDFGTGNVSFDRSKFNKLSLKACHLNSYFNLRVEKCNLIDLSDTIVRDIIDLQPVKNEKVFIKHLNIEGMRLLGRIDIDWNENNVLEMISSQDFTNNREKSEQLRILKENYGNIGHYSYEDQAYINFKRFEEKAERDEAIARSPISRFWQIPMFYFKVLIFDRMGLYATSPVRVLTSLVIVYFGFSIIHFIAPFFLDTSINCIADDIGIIERLLDTFYYSIITFTTVGYGDCSPVGALRFVASLEGFFGVFMMSYFTVAFARKILR